MSGQRLLLIKSHVSGYTRKDGTFVAEHEDKRTKKVASVAEKKLHVTETQAFKKWFGDSKVVDKKSKPLVVYHGTKSDIESFDVGSAGKNFGDDSGFFFTPNPSNAQAYASGEGANLIPAYLSLQNPFVIKFDGFNSDRQFFHRRKEIMAAAEQGGHDGVIAEDNAGNKTYVAFHPEQIKSATGNNGNFDPKHPDITKAILVLPKVMK